MKAIKFFPQSKRVHFAALAVCPLLGLRLLMMSFAFFRSCSVSIRCIFVDALLDIFMALGNLWVIQKIESHPTPHFPFGLGKSAHLWNLLQGGLLSLAALDLGWESLKSYHQAQKALIYREADHFALWATLITAVIVLLEHVANRSAKHAVLRASELNHAFDLFTYLLGMLSSFLLARGYFGLDYLLALCIVSWMGVSGFWVIWRACLALLDAQTDSRAFLELESLVQEHMHKVAAQARFKRMRCRDYGQWRQAEIELFWPEELTLGQVNQAVHQLKQSLQLSLPQTQFAFSHTPLPTH